MWDISLHVILRGIAGTNLMMFYNNFRLHGMFLDFVDFKDKNGF